MSPTALSTIVPLLCVAVIFIDVSQSQDDWRPSEFSTTCGLNNAPEREFGHEGLLVKTKESMLGDVRLCSWTVVHPAHLATHYIHIKVKNVTSSGVPCDDSRQLFVGEASDPSTMQHLCGPISYSEVFPSSVLIQIKGDTGGELDEIEMDVTLEVVDYLRTCNRTYYDENRVIGVDSTLDPDEYLLLPYNCFWKFHTPSRFDKYVVHLTSVDLKVEDPNSSGCQNNTLTVIAGYELTDEQLTQTCTGSDLTFTTSENSVIVSVMILDPSQQTLAFNFSVTPFSLTQCYGQIIHLQASSDDKYITSPGYPDSIYEHLNCQWRIESGDGNEVEIEFVDLDLTPFDCENDYVMVFDGADQTAQQLASVCGAPRGDTKKYRSSGKMFLIQFRMNDYNTQGKGFKLLYHTKKEASPDLVPDRTCRRNTVHLPATSQDKYLELFTADNPYNPNLSCNWVLNSSNGDPIEVEIADIAIETTAYCEGDALEIFDGVDMKASPLVTACGHMTYYKMGTKFRSSGTEVLIHFKTNDQLQYDGFKLKYYTKAQPSSDLSNVASCRGKVENLLSSQEVQNLTSPGFPTGYPPYSDCRWQIQAEPGNTTKLDIVSLDTEKLASNAYCLSNDFIEVFDGPSVFSKSLGRFCTGTKSFKSTGRYLTVQFRSNGENSGHGFNLQYYTPSATVSKGNPGGGSTQNKACVLLTVLSTMLILLGTTHRHI